LREMGYVKCKRCKKDFVIDDSNPNVHYATSGNEMCGWCRYYKSLKRGEWYQNATGDYLQKQ